MKNRFRQIGAVVATNGANAAMAAGEAEVRPHVFYVADYQQVVKGGILPYSESVWNRLDPAAVRQDECLYRVPDRPSVLSSSA